jgi:hypothetical protein
MMAPPSTKEIGSYMKSRFLAELKGSVDKLQMPRFSVDLLEECNFATTLLVRAARNQSKSPHFAACFVHVFTQYVQK